MKKDKFYRLCRGSKQNCIYKEDMDGYTQIYDDVILHAYISGDSKCVIEDKTGLAVLYFYGSYKSSFDEAYKVLKGAADNKGKSISEFLSGCESVREVSLTTVDVFSES